MSPKTTGLTIRPRRIPKWYQILFKGVKSWGVIIETNKKLPANTTKKRVDIVESEYQCCLRAIRRNTAVKKKPNLRLVGRFSGSSEDIILISEIIFMYICKFYRNKALINDDIQCNGLINLIIKPTY